MKKLLMLALLSLGLVLLNFQGLAHQGEFDSLVLDFREDIPQTEIQAEVDAIAQRYNLHPHLNSIYSVTDNVYIVEGDKDVLRTLRKSANLRQGTEYIEPNYVYHAFDAPNDPDYAKQWNLRSINVEQAWDNTKGSGVTVAVIDTGVTKVADLGKTKFTKGYDFVNDQSAADDDVGHGTHVAGTIAQSTNNAFGVAGVAYEANIMPIKVLSASGGGTVADIAEAIRFAADQGADVINLSLGGAGESKLMQEAINHAYQKDVVIVAAAGNANQNAAAYPARYPHVIGVSALDAAGQKAAYSNFGAGVDISAPGGGEGGKILQHTINPETGEAAFLEFQGTSMAAPHVAGVAALVKAAGIHKPAEVLNVLKQSVRKVQEDPLNHFGAGHLDAGSAVKLALRGQITFQDFFRWLRDNGYLNPRFWIDGGTITLLPKIAMVVGSYLLAFILRNYLPFWSGSLLTGIIAGSSGLFFLKGFYIFDLPQYPFRILGSSIPELGNAISGTSALNPLFASVLIPLVLIALFLGHPQGKWVAIGSALGVASCLGVYALIDPQLWGLGSGWLARVFLIANAFACFGLAYLASQGETKTV